MQGTEYFVVINKKCSNKVIQHNGQTVKNKLVQQNIWHYRGGVAQTTVIIAGFYCTLPLKICEVSQISKHLQA